MERLVGADVIADLKKNVLPAGLRDVQDWTGVDLSFIRRDEETGGWIDVGTMPAISIRLNANQPLEAVGAVETTTRGTAKVWADDVQEKPLEQGDQFVWDDRVCVVDLVAPARVDVYVALEFTLKGK